MFKFSLILLSSYLLFNSCAKKKVECDGSTPTYISDIKAILDMHCMSCHEQGSAKGDFSTYQKLLVVINNGSFDYEVLSRQSMPRGGKLSNSELSKIQCWMENGWPEN
jgi:hypothetical protein